MRSAFQSTLSSVSETPEIRQRYQDGERDFQGLEISDPVDSDSFRGAGLDGAEFSRAFVVADFSEASLRNCKFSEANIKTCIFDRADLHGSDFSNALIDAAAFRSARFGETNFAGATEEDHPMKPGEVPMR